MKRMFSFLVMIMMVFSLISCAAAPDYYDDSREDSEENQEQENMILPGQITVCAYNDNDKFSYWQSLLTTTQEGPGIFNTYYNSYDFNAFNRLKLVFPAKSYVEVSLLKDNETICTSVADRNGVCYLYPPFKATNYDISIRYLNQNDEYVETKEVVSGDTSFIIDSKEIDINRIELMFVIDTTGSMGDEINYLKAEVKDVINRVNVANPNSEIVISIILYRDTGDNYIVKSFDFSKDIDQAQNFLNQASANGGGDFEEAVQVAMKEALNKQWSDNSTKLLVHIADAPAHDEDVKDWNKYVLQLAQKGVHIITVASSGIDKKTEYFFRSQSIITNGHYLYITDDSGVGGDHLEATVEERPVVEYLNDSLVRLINGYHTGVFAEPIYYGNVNGNQ